MTGKPADLDQWRALAERELKASPDSLVRETPEDIRVKPLYTAADLDGLAHLGSLLGLAPFTRGLRATMYAGRPWTIRQYAGFSTAEASNAFYRRALAAGQGASRWLSTSLPIAAMTPTIPACWAISARLGSLSIASRT